MTTLQQAIEVIQAIPMRNVRTVRKKGIASRLLGKCKGVIPNGKTSTEWIRDLRQALYGKI